ncbi:MAG: DUF3110 domain-containing protein [Cyanobacteria bacterium]|nr:DUF3110 domain-containing protein [Cyanobacteriota bacterium]MDA0865901.1 DUF3110 domain-containing protein [Cyanobacteriota bacterium]
MQVYVLLFNAGTDNEGIHSLNANGHNTVLMFEQEDDAIRFGLMLEAQDFLSPTVERFEEGDIEEFCEGAGLEFKRIPAGTLVTPPDNNVERTDWDPEHPADYPIGDVVDGMDETDDSGLSQQEMDMLRQRLEKLL